MAAGDQSGTTGKAPEVGVGFSDGLLLTVSAIGFVMLAATVYSIVITKLKGTQEIDNEERELTYEEILANADVATLTRAQRRARARHIMKQQRRIAPATTGEDDDRLPNEDENALVPEEPIPPAAAANDGQTRHLSRRERQKAAKVAEKEERRLFEEERRLQQEQASKVAQREKKERERLQLERQEEERRIRQEQQLAEEMASYEKWRTFLESPDKTTSLSVQDWIKELQSSKTAHVDKLAERFDLPKDAVSLRIRKLVATSRVAGVWEDDTFVFISPEELQELASFVKGRDSTSLDAIAMKMSSISSRR